MENIIDLIKRTAHIACKLGESAVLLLAGNNIFMLVEPTGNISFTIEPEEFNEDKQVAMIDCETDYLTDGILERDICLDIAKNIIKKVHVHDFHYYEPFDMILNKQDIDDIHSFIDNIDEGTF